MNEMTDTHILTQYLDYRETVSLEAATNQVAAAYTNAIYNAIGGTFLRVADHAGEDSEWIEGAGR